MIKYYNDNSQSLDQEERKLINTNVKTLILIRLYTFHLQVRLKSHT